MPFKILPVFAFVLILFAACAPTSAQQSFNATLPALTITAPIYTNTPPVSSTPSPSETPLATSTVAPTATETAIPTSTPFPTLAGTQPLITLTPATSANSPAADERGAAPLSPVTGWSCDDFPCADDLSGWLQRIQVPPGFRVEHVGRFPGQPMQITYGREGRLYATVLENGTRSGAVYVMEADGTTARYSDDFISPLGLAFQPATDVLYVSARMTLEQGGGVWRITPGSPAELVIGDLPCCFRIIDNQPDGIIFGQDGYLYLGVGSLSDTTANPPRSARAWAEVQLYEASILRIDPLTATVETYAQGIRNPFDLAADSTGQLFATDNGLLTGQGGDRLLQVAPGAHYGWPYWGARGCTNCPIQPNAVHISPDLLAFPPYTLPRGIVAYTGTQFPSNLFDNLFVALWNGVEGEQRIVRIDPQRAAEAGYVPEAFVTGLIRPIDLALAPDGSLVVADYVYGNVWRIVYEG
ncbi:MAG: PQQ-dependent sugar dehydrogenase [Chloroflexota bacterium]